MIKKTYNSKFVIRNYRELRNSFLARLFEPSRKNLLIFRSFSARQPAKVASKSAPATSFVIHRNCNRGMTYVELIVVLGIFFVLSSIVLFNYGDFQDRVDIKNLASDITLKIVEAQKSSLNGVWNLSAFSNWKPSYGVYFNPSAAVDLGDDIAFNKKFLYFSDLDNNSFYDGLSTCTAECLDKIVITKNSFISRIDSYTDSVPTQITNPLSVIFKRPDSSAIFVSSDLLLLPNFDYIQITVASARGATALIKLYPSGRIQVN